MQVTLWRVPVKTVAVEKQQILHILSVCVCSLNYPACNAHVPHRHLWPVRLYNIFHYLIHGTIFGKMFLNINCVHGAVSKLMHIYARSSAGVYVFACVGGQGWGAVGGSQTSARPPCILEKNSAKY